METEREKIKQLLHEQKTANADVNTNTVNKVEDKIKDNKVSKVDKSDGGSTSPDKGKDKVSAPPVVSSAELVSAAPKAKEPKKKEKALINALVAVIERAESMQGTVVEDAPTVCMSSALTTTAAATTIYDTVQTQRGSATPPQAPVGVAEVDDSVLIGYGSYVSEEEGDDHVDEEGECSFNQFKDSLGDLSVQRTAEACLAIWLTFVLFIGYLLEFTTPLMNLLFVIVAFLWNMIVLKFYMFVQTTRKGDDRKQKTLITRQLADYFKTRPKGGRQLLDQFATGRTNPVIGRHRTTTITPTVNIYANAALTGELMLKDFIAERPYLKVTVKPAINGMSFEQLEAADVDAPKVEIESLLDLGASTNMCSKGLFDLLQQRSESALPWISCDLLVHTFLGDASSAVAATVLNVALGDAPNQKVLQQVPFLIYEHDTPKLILGMNCVKTHRLITDYEGDKMFVKFKNTPNIKIPVTFKFGDEHNLISCSEVQIHPKETVTANLTLEQYPRLDTNLCRQPVYVRSENEESVMGVVLDQASTVGRRGIVPVTLFNHHDTTLVIPQGAVIGRMEPITSENSCPIDALMINQEVEDGRRNNCYCNLVNRLFLCTSAQFTGIGREMSGPSEERKLKDPGLHVMKDGSRCDYFLVPDGAGQYKLDMDSLPAKIGEELYVIYDSPSLINRSLLEILAKLATRTTVKWHPLIAQGDNDEMCACKKARLTSRLTITDVRQYSTLNVHILVTKHVLPGDWNKKTTCSEQLVFDIYGTRIVAYASSASQFSIVIHVPERFAKDLLYIGNVMRILAHQIKPLFPRSTLSVSTNFRQYEGEPITAQNVQSLKDTIKGILEESSAYPDHWSAEHFEDIVRQRVKQEEALIRLSLCDCLVCRQAPESRVQERTTKIFTGAWPTVAASDDAVVAHIAACTLSLFPENPRAGHDPAQVQEEPKRLLELYTEPAGYSEDNLQATDQNVIARMNELDWRSHFDINTVMEEARPYVERLLDTHKQVVSWDKNDFKPIKNFRLVLSPANTQPFINRPIPVANHLLDTVHEMMSTMAAKHWICMPHDDPVFISSAFLVRKCSSEFRKLTPDSKKVPYKSRGSKYPENTVGGMPSEDLDEGQQGKISWRMVVDFRRVNEQLGYSYNDNNLISAPFLQYPKVRGATLFSQFDLQSAFNCMLLHPNSRKFMHFHIANYLRAFVVCPLGVKILPSVFGQLIDRVIRPSIRAKILVYADDVLVATSGTVEDHYRVINELLEDFGKVDLLVSGGKMNLFCTEVSYLGVLLDGEKVRILPERNAHFQRLSLPTNKAEMSSFLGVAGFMSSFIYAYQLKVAPLYDTLKTGQAFKLTPAHVEIIREVARDIDQAPSLVHLDHNLRLYCAIDSSRLGHGAVFYHLINGRKLFVEFVSYKLAEPLSTSLTSCEIEFVGLLRVVQSKQVYFASGALDILVLIDMRAIYTLVVAASTTHCGKLARWAMKLSELAVSFQLHYCPGPSATMRMSDFLSRSPYNDYLKEKQAKTWSRENAKLLMEKIYVPFPENWKGKTEIKPADVIDAANAAVNAGYIPAEREIVSDNRHDVNDLLVEADQNRMKSYFGKLYDEAPLEVDAVTADEAAVLVSQSTVILDPRIEVPLPQQVDGLNISHHLTPESVAADQQEDPELKSIIEVLRTTGPEREKKRYQRYRLLHGFLLGYRKGKLSNDPQDSEFKVVLPQKSAVIAIVLAHLWGHASQAAVVERLKPLFYINSIIHLVTAVISSCRTCRLYRVPTKVAFPKGHMRHSQSVFDVVSLDHIDLGPTIYKRKQIRYALTIKCLFSRYLFSAMCNTLSAENTVALLEEFFGNFGPPNCLISDCGSVLLTNALVQKVCKKYGVRIALSLPNKTGGHSSVETANRVFRSLLMKNAEMLQTTWSVVFHFTKMQLNGLPRRYCMPTEHMPDAQPIITSPYEIVFGRPLMLDFEMFKAEGITQSSIDRFRTNVRKTIEHYAQKEQRLRDEADARHKQTEFKVGDVVLIRRHPASKKETKYLRNLYQITDLLKRRALVTNMYGKPACLRIHLEDLKHFNSSPLIAALPDDLRDLFGKYIPPPRAPLGRTKKPPSDILPAEPAPPKPWTRQAAAERKETTQKQGGMVELRGPTLSSLSSLSTHDGRAKTVQTIQADIHEQNDRHLPPPAGVDVNIEVVPNNNNNDNDNDDDDNNNGLGNNLGNDNIAPAEVVENNIPVNIPENIPVNTPPAAPAQPQDNTPKAQVRFPTPPVKIRQVLARARRLFTTPPTKKHRSVSRPRLNAMKGRDEAQEHKEKYDTYEKLTATVFKSKTKRAKKKVDIASTIEGAPRKSGRVRKAPTYYHNEFA